MPEVWSTLNRARARSGRRTSLGAGPLDSALGVLADRGRPGATAPARLAAPAVSPRAAEVADAALADLIGPSLVAEVREVRRAGGASVLPPYRLVLAASRLAASDPAEHDRIRELLTDVSATFAAYQLAVLAAGRGVATMASLAAEVADRSTDAGWLHRHLGVLDGQLGPAAFVDDDGAELRLRQLSPTTCGPTCAIVLRVLADPAYALWLTTGAHPDPARSTRALPFEQRFRAQQQAVHRAVTRRALGPLRWPRFFGSPPWALATFLNRFSGLTGAHFGWVPVDAGDPTHLHRCVAAIERGVQAGIPVPLYVGRHVDRHVVLALAVGGEALTCYEPAGGEVVEVALGELRAGRVQMAGWDHLESLLAARLLAF